MLSSFGCEAARPQCVAYAPLKANQYVPYVTTCNASCKMRAATELEPGSCTRLRCPKLPRELSELTPKAHSLMPSSMGPASFLFLLFLLGGSPSPRPSQWRCSLQRGQTLETLTLGVDGAEVPEAAAGEYTSASEPVSYTHLTLPTNREV